MNLGDSQYGLQIYSFADNFNMFTGYFHTPNVSRTVETRLKRLYTTKTKT
tara:strand:+ start:103 stop:252 length:150 start_codon:yes stop_codon:yes gene_type:complete